MRSFTASPIGPVYTSRWSRVRSAGRCRPGDGEASIRDMSIQFGGNDTETRPAAVRTPLLASLTALSVGAAAIHFAVVFEHFAEYILYGVFFLVIAWAQLIWPV